MTNPAPFQGRIQTVEAQWADFNGHLNMAYYHVLFDRAGDEAFSAIGLGPNYVTQHNATFFTVEAHVSYLAELKPGDKVRVGDAVEITYMEAFAVDVQPTGTSKRLRSLKTRRQAATP